MKTVSGGPQGSVLVPLLFNMYIADIPCDEERKCYNTRAAKFVDDICIYSTGEVQEQIPDLNKRLNDVFEWSNRWGVDFNVGKCRTMTFTKEIRKESYDRTVVMGGKVVQNVSTYKYLGITFNSNMFFDTHVDNIVKKCNKESFLMLKVCKKSMIGKRLCTKILWRTKRRNIIELWV